MPDGANLILGSEGNPLWKTNNTSDATTKLQRNGTGNVGVTALVVENLDGPGVEAVASSGPGVEGISSGGAGVSGRGTGLGVYGTSDLIGVKGEGAIGVHGNAETVGVRGDAGAYGVFATAKDGFGVFGLGNVGVLGQSSSGAFGLGNVGVRGDATGIGVEGSGDLIGVDGTGFGPSSGPRGNFGIGVRGVSRTDRFGVQGRSDKAVVFRSDQSFSARGAGVLAESPTGTGLLARTGAPTGLAGLFVGDVAIGGNVFVLGSVTVTGGKSASVPHPDGSQRLTFALECPESFFEDFGRGRVVRGRARVEIDRNFAVLVDRKEYFVFVTPEGESQGLYVSKRGRDSFEVREQQGGTSTLAFSYRLVARRKDLPRRRLPKGIVRELRVLDLPRVKATQGRSAGRKAPLPPSLLKELDRVAPSKARRVTRGPKGRRRAKKG